MTKHNVLVYGTLKRGQGNHRCIADQEFIGEANTLLPDFQMYHLGGFPGVVKGTGKIYGEMFRVSEESLHGPLDGLEGHPDFYKRQIVEVVCNGKVYDAWMYIYRGDVSKCQPLEGVW
jgi:gamma-glutamylcyclotransferase (GGCT)/AIG2-like uncharacterized protein YtfP